MFKGEAWGIFKNVQGEVEQKKKGLDILGGLRGVGRAG